MNKLVLKLYNYKYISVVVFTLFVILFVFSTDLYTYFDLPPIGIHKWRQSDCTSMTLNYYQEGNNFFKPEIHAYISDDYSSGKSGAEFPIVYYIISILYHIFGENFTVFRLFTFLLFLTSNFFFFKSLVARTNNLVLSILATGVIFSSPSIIFYSIGFVPDIHAFSVSLISFSFFVNYIEKQKLKDLIVFLALSSLAGLLKPTSLLIYFSFLGVLFFQTFETKKYKLFLLSLVPIITTVLWFAYIKNYNEIHKSIYFNTNIVPMWKIKGSIIDFNIEYYNRWRSKYFSPYVLLFLVFSFFAILGLFKSIKKEFKLFFIFFTIGIISYFILFNDAFKYHDYYLINFALFFPIILYVLFSSKYIAEKRIVQYALSVVLLGLVGYAIIIHDKFEIADSMMFQSSTNFDNCNLEKEREFIRSVGLTDSTKVIFGEDFTPNYSLHKLNIKGWTSLFAPLGTPQIFNKIVNSGAEYIISTKIEELGRFFVLKYPKTFYSFSENIVLFKLGDTAFKQVLPVPELLSVKDSVSQAEYAFLTYHTKKEFKNVVVFTVLTNAVNSEDIDIVLANKDNAGFIEKGGGLFNKYKNGWNEFLFFVKIPKNTPSNEFVCYILNNQKFKIKDMKMYVK